MTDEKLPTRFAAVLAMGLCLLSVATWCHAQGTNQIQEACADGCRQKLEAFRKAGENPTQLFMETCMRSCLKGNQLKSRDEVPRFCQETCTGFMRSIGKDQNPQAMQHCVENCKQDGYKMFAAPPANR